MNDIIEILNEDFPSIKIKKVIDFNATKEDSLTGKILTIDNIVYNFIIYKDTLRPILQRFL